MFKFSKLITNIATAISPNVFIAKPQVIQPAQTQIRTKYYQVKFHGSKNYWPQWSMMKDQTRRQVLKEYAPQRIRYNAIRKSELLPSALKEVADYEIARLPRISCKLWIKNRCTVTSKGKGNVSRWRVSRFIFRHLADYNKLAGVQRGFWD